MADPENDEQAPETTDAASEVPAGGARGDAQATGDRAGGKAEQQPAPKERRARRRSAQPPPVSGPRTPAERQAERDATRRVKAVRRREQRIKDRAKRAARRAAAPAAPPLAPVHAPTEGRRKVRQGVVVSDGADKTITVRVDVARRHRRYQKIVRSSSTLHAHDESNDAHVGDTVRVIESRPLSRTKRWRLVDVLERAE
jgi:small subunit ribosomal protein S17